MLLAFVMSSCATNMPDPTSPGGFIYYNVDFKKYSDQGFQITVEKPNGVYKSIGLVSVELYPEVRKMPKGLYDSVEDGFINFGKKKYRVWKRFEGDGTSYYATEIINTQEAINEIFEVSKEWGADAIVNFDISRKENVITVSGFAIQRNTNQ